MKLLGILKNIGLPLLMVVPLVSGCKQSLDVESGSRQPSILQPDSASPSITVPGESVHFSNSSVLEIRGICLANATVILSGADSQQVSCENFEYSFTVNKVDDGSYNFAVSQDLGTSESRAEALLWIKKSTVSKPALISPSGNPYFSGETILNITGSCETGAELILLQGGIGQTTCVNSAFALTVQKFSDGTYPIEIAQRDQAGNESSTLFNWVKQGLDVTPNNPQIVVTNSQVFTVSGGSNAYTVTFVENNSGGTFDAGTLTYVAGTLSGVVDRIRLEDGQGFSRDIDIQVVADIPDHFEFPTVVGDGQESGDNQTETIGQAFAMPLVAKVVDQYGNGVPFYPVIFERTSGDVLLVDSMRQTTDVNGLAFMNVIQGFTEVRSYIQVKPRGVLLPDILGTGQTRLTYQTLSNNNNTSKFDLKFSTGSNPEDTFIGDVSGDGNQDILVLNKGENSISILLGVGNGLTTSAPKLLNVCISPTSMTVADFDGDNFVDVLLSCSSNNEYTFLSGNGDGTFNSPSRTPLSLDESLPVAIKHGDFDGDGDLDFVVTSAGTSKLAVRIGNGDGTFAAPSLPLLDTGSSPSKLGVGDLDNLNGDDIVVINAGEDSFSAFINDGLGGFAAQVKYDTGLSPADIVVADLNSDGFDDVSVVNNTDNNVKTHMNNATGDGSLDIFGSFTSVGLGPISIYSGDVVGDSSIDLVVANIGDNTISILTGANNGSFSTQPAISVDTSPIFVSSGDLNNDTNADITVVSNGESKIEIIPGQPSGALGFLTDVGNNPTKSLTGDLDGDGIADKVVLNRNDNSISLFKGDGKGLFTSLATPIVTANDTRDASLVDLNNDGILDLVIVFGASGLRVYLGQGLGTFASPDSYGASTQPEAIATGDFNDDGFLDIVVACSGIGRVSFFPGVGDGTFGSRSDSNTGAQPVDLVAADLNFDGRVDLAVAQASELGGSVGVMISSGDGTFLTPVHYQAESGVLEVTAGYYNSDGFVDLAVLNATTASVSIFLSGGDGTFSTASNYFSGFDPSGMSSGDFNGDGRVDLIVGNGVNQTVTILQGSLSGSYAINSSVNTGVNTVHVDINDLNADGALDFSVLDGSFNKLKVLLGH